MRHDPSEPHLSRGFGGQLDGLEAEVRISEDVRKPGKPEALCSIRCFSQVKTSKLLKLKKKSELKLKEILVKPTFISVNNKTVFSFNLIETKPIFVRFPH